MPQPLERKTTIDDLDALPDDEFKYELQAGLLVSEPLPGTRHGLVAARVAELLGAYVRHHRLGIVLSNDSGFILSRSPDTLRGPDVSFIARARVQGRGDLTRAFPGAPDLAVEVLSPSNTPEGIRIKVGEYLAAGTRCVWVIDTITETVVVYRSILAPRTLTGDEILEGAEVVPGFHASLAELFEI